MRVPVLDGNRVQQGNLPSVQVQNVQTPDAMVNLTNSKMFGEIGQALGAYEQSRFDVYNKERQQLDRVGFQAGANTVAMNGHNLQFNPDDGYETLKGASVVKFKDSDDADFVTHYFTKFQNGNRAVEDSLTTPEQKRMFREHIGPQETAFLGRLQNYYLQHNDAYKKEVSQTGVDQFGMQLSGNVHDDTATEANMLSLANAVRTAGQVNGWDESTIQLKTAEAGSKQLRTGFEALAANGDAATLKKQFAKYGNYLLPQDQDGVINTIHSNNAADLKQQIIIARDSGDVTTLQQLGHALEKGDYTKGDFNTDIGKTRVPELMNAISVATDQIIKKNEVKEQKRTNEAGKVYKNFEADVLTGRMLDDSLFENAGVALKGTQYETDYKFLVEQYKTIQAFRRKDPAIQKQLINETEARLANSKSKDPVREQKMLGIYKTIFNTNKTEASNDSKQYLSIQGVQMPKIEPNLITQDPASAVKQFVSIGSTLVAARQKDAHIVLKVFSDDELVNVKKNFEGLSPERKLDFIGGLINEASHIRSGEEIWGSILGQLGKEGNQSSAYIMAGIAKHSNFKSTSGEDVGLAILKGLKLRENKQLVLPKEDQFRAAFNDYMGNAVSGQKANMLYEAFKNLYVYQANANGVSHRAGDESLDDSSKNRALSLASGGVFVQNINYRTSNGKVLDWKVLKPYGRTDDNFEKNLDAAYYKASQTLGYKIEDLKEFLLVNVGVDSRTREYLYQMQLRNGNVLPMKDKKGQVLRDKNGAVRPYLIRIY